MIARWLFNNSHEKLIIFCNGWGMDHNPVSPLESGGYDVLCLSDYSNLELPFDPDTLGASYQSINLLSWSFGVWAAQHIFGDRTDAFDRCVAINGTLRPIDDRYGIPHQFFKATLDNFSESVRDRFYRRMCRPDPILEFFLDHQPERSLAGQQAELEIMAKLVGSYPAELSLYDTAIVSFRDMIVPTAHQRSFWQNRCPVIGIDGCHYPFAGFNSWSEILEMQE